MVSEVLEGRKMSYEGEDIDFEALRKVGVLGMDSVSELSLMGRNEGQRYLVNKIITLCLMSLVRK